MPSGTDLIRSSADFAFSSLAACCSAAVLGPAAIALSAASCRAWLRISWRTRRLRIAFRTFLVAGTCSDDLGRRDRPMSPSVCLATCDFMKASLSCILPFGLRDTMAVFLSDKRQNNGTMAARFKEQGKAAAGKCSGCCASVSPQPVELVQPIQRVPRFVVQCRMPQDLVHCKTDPGGSACCDWDC